MKIPVTLLVLQNCIIMNAVTAANEYHNGRSSDCHVPRDVITNQSLPR